MKGQLLIDNWTLQNAGELLSGARDPKMAQELRVAPDAQSVTYAQIPQDIVAMACVCQLVQSLVFSDQLLTDADYASSWSDLPPIMMLARNGILVTKPFKEAEATWAARREWIAESLCESPVVRAQHERNKADYAATGQSGDPMLAQILWGAAGLLARAEYAHLTYTPHPLRERLLMRSRFLAKAGDARATLTSFIDGQQLKLYRSVECEGLYGALRLPPVVVEALQSVSTLQDVIPAAMELRGKYHELRQWLTEFQHAFDCEDIEEVLAHRKVLWSVGERIERLSGDKAFGSATLQFGAHFPKLTVNLGTLVSDLRQRVGIRGQINRLILSPPGKNVLKRFAQLLEPAVEARGSLEAAFHAFQTRDARPESDEKHRLTN